MGAGYSVDGCLDGWIYDKWMSGWVSEFVCGWMVDGWMDCQMDKLVGG